MAIHTIARHARQGVTVVVESTVAVGMTRELLSSLAATQKAKVGMSPERVDPGRKFPAFRKITKIISGIDPRSLEAVHQLYGRMFDHLIPVSSLEAAEMTKLYENGQRMVCAAYANEMADACTSLNIDGWEVSRAAASKPFGYLPFWPEPGIRGPCIPVNPCYLPRTCNMPILQHTTEISWRRPSEIVGRLMRDIEDKWGMTGAQPLLSGSTIRIFIVGVGFKKGQTVLDNSPGVAAIQCLLREYNVDVEFADPLVDQAALTCVPKLDTA
ncbi:hypothetical protein TI39_contig358g00009 [Zymoseptoria brevis]|uniref:UDP-glucose/GDP-mannose dehydrogenase dimerisation domain-containing protein n=1 Tax=Zymoseptoria brevis TaxID=1047168 RepID=A0A0F4GQE7_9PEZI|nr:hypothetical protein TI39_contig358g00009 [Zymoseptoria brevis]